MAPPFFSDPILYARYSQAASYVPRERNLMNYVLVKAQDGVDPEELCQRIEQQTGRMALTRGQFFWKTVRYFLSSTGIPVNFGITILLGFIVGAAVTGQTLYLFVVESLKPIKGEVRWYCDRKAGIVFDQTLPFEELAEWVGKRLELASLKATYQKH